MPSPRTLSLNFFDFQKLFTFAESLERDPVLILSEMSFSDICSVIEFVYTGNLKISHDQLNHFLAVAGKLQIKGVVGFSIDIKDENEGNFPVIIFGENRVNGVKNVNTEPGGLGSSTIESSSDVSDSPRLIVKQINEIRVLRKCKQSKENIAKSSCKLSCEHCRRKFEKKRTAYNHRRFCLLNPNKRASRCPFCLEVVKPGSMTYHKKTYHAYVPAKRRNTKIAP